MLQLKNVTKIYDIGDSKVQALNGVSIEFRENEFVSILGQSGCGKTTLLNIIGGLDRYTDGDLIINGKSTKDFSDADWDTYRNHSVGFVFQSYNLIPHQTVLANVELALTISGVSKSERRRRAIEALEKVGLGDQIKKKPNQMSGGQMQRVAIARAIVNDPDILLADEPTGALDTATSIQIMDILREIAKDKLVIMVTHNPEIAEEYSTRIVRLLDGKVTDDSDPYHHENEATVVRETNVKKDKKTSMSFATALSLSLNNLMTKKGRTIMTVFAGSIGIIGIALILSLSNGIKSYIDDVQKDTLSSYPIQINKQTMDMTTMMSNMMSDNITEEELASRDPNKIYSNNILSEMMNAMNDGVTVNNLAEFKTFIENNEELSDKSVISAIQYTYGMNMNIYSADTSSGAIQVNPSRVMSILMQSIGLGATDDSMTASIGSMYGLNVWTEMLDNPELLDSQYELLDPDTMHWPRNYDEVILVVNKNNELSDVALFALGLKDPAEFEKMIATMMDGGSYEIEDSTYTYDDLMNLTYRVVLPTDYYVYDEETDTYIDKSKNEDHIKGLVENGIELKVVGIVRARDGAVSTSISGTVGYTKSLTEFIAREIGKSELLNSQLENKDVNILTGQEFDKGQYKDLSEEKRAELFLKYSKEKMTNAEKSKIILSIMSAMTEEERESMITSLPEDIKAALMPVDLTEYTDVQLVNYIMLNIEKYPVIYEQFMIDMMDMMFAKILEQMPEEQRPQAEAYYAAMTKEQKLEQIENQYADQTEQEKEESLRQTLSLLPREACMVYASAIAQEEMIAKLESNSGSLTEMALLYDSAVSAMDTAQLSGMYGAYMPSLVSEKTYDEVLSTLGMVDLDNPEGIYLYAASFEAKDRIQEIIEEYNKTAEEEGRNGDVISYTDIIGIMMSFFSDVIDAISYVLVAFVSISLVVSAIMIGIITYISVLERTKEIGILRAMGASKGDISSVFNAETMIVGFAAGLFGIISTVLMIIPINAIIFALTGIPNIKAILPIDAALILVAISVVLTLVAGLIPSLAAAKKDPVIALRSE